MRYKLCILFFLFKILSYAQGEANNWYFGNKAGISFNSGVPVALTDGEMQADEGCATLSDANGQLLFYTNGITVWNRNHQIMPNGTGLLGHQSSTQSGTIVPMPGSTHLFYVFTLDFQSNPNGFRYSIIDLNLDGGLGAVTSTKNVLIYTPSCEKISVVKHANDSDYWIVTRESNNNRFNALLLSNSGLSNTPIISNSSFSITQNTETLGAMKISPDGTKIAVCYDFFPNARLELLEFNNVTGQLSNPQIIATSTTGGGFYGVEFSPNSKLLYVCEGQGRKIHQFNLLSSPISSSQVLLFDDGPVALNFPRSLQLAPDGKIYVAMTGQTFLSVINNPNLQGIACGFSLNAVGLDGRFCYFGLPVFNQSYFAPAIQFQNSCVGETVEFQLSNPSVTSALWNFGDGTISNSLSPSHAYTAPGVYTVSVTATSSIGIGVTSRDITIAAIPMANQPENILICDSNNDGFFNFDLTSRKSSILNGQPENQFSIQYFASNADYLDNNTIDDPTSFINPIAYQSQNVIAEVYSLVNQSCSSTTTFNVQVFESPTPSFAVSPIQLCDNTTYGSESDGRVLFDVTSNQTHILNGQSALNFTLFYYKDNLYTDLIVNPTNYINTNQLETIYVKVVNVQNPACFATTFFQVEVFNLPIINAALSLKQCDDNNDGFSAFNLAEASELVVPSITGLSFSYHLNLADAQNDVNPIINETAYVNPNVNTSVVYVRVENANGCYRIATLNLTVSTTLIPASFQRVFSVCDDENSGSNTDGIASFNFSSVTADIQALFPVGQQLVVRYYQDLNDALAEQNPISNTSNFINTNSPTTQNIYVRVDSQLDNECLGLGHHVTLLVEPIPLLQTLSFTECDDDQDGILGFNTADLQTTLLNSNTNVTVNYWDENGFVLPSPLPNPFYTNSQTVKVRATNNTITTCFYETTITFNVDLLPIVNSIPSNFTVVCDDEINPQEQDGIFAFDTSTIQNSILGGQLNMIVNYFDEAGNPLSSPLPNPFVSSTQTIMVEVINSVNNNCKATGLIFFVVNEIPIIELEGSELICSNNPLFTKVLTAELIDETLIENYFYQWFKDDIFLFDETNYSLTVNSVGNYSVNVTNSNNCIRTRTIAVTASNIASIESIEINDLSNYSNAITILVAGSGDYVYSLDNTFFQVSNTFVGIESGIYSVYVKDLNGCGIATDEISVLGIPKYFTPNGDGYNDFWNIKGYSNSLYSEIIIYVFDRFGKLLVKVNPLENGWDGSLDGLPMPATDYWYSIKFQYGRIIHGHFALKR
jgi:gliding motility-associated-like protein